MAHPWTSTLSCFAITCTHFHKNRSLSPKEFLESGITGEKVIGIEPFGGHCHISLCGSWASLFSEQMRVLRVPCCTVLEGVSHMVVRMSGVVVCLQLLA
jgi:hypothetical protein